MQIKSHWQAGLLIAGATLSCSGSLAQAQSTATTDDVYLRGYVQALLDQQPAWATVKIQTEQGNLIIDGDGLSGEELTQLMQTLGKVRGVKSVRLSTEPLQPMEASALASDTSPSPASPDASRSAVASMDSPLNAPAELTPQTGMQIFPKDRLFEPLLGDPRWPHFGASYTSYQGETLKAVATVSFGETLSLYRDDAPDWLGGQWEFVLQPGMFAIFDLDAPSADLVNADYTIGGGFAWLNGPWSALLRVYHMSSHLGDEFILNNGLTPAQRINLSYEQLQLLLSYQAADWLRVYGGAGVLMNTDPANLDNTTIQYGVELRAPWRFLEEWATPILAMDVKHLEYHDWDGDFSVRAGLEFADPRLGKQSSRMLVVIEYYTGRSPHGQFFNESIRYLGAGLHFYY